MTMRSIALALCVGVLASPVCADFHVVKEGQAACAIGLPADPHPALARAAEELQRYIEQSTGAKIPVMSQDVRERGLAPIILAVADWEGYPTSPLGRARDAYEIRVTADQILIEGPDPACVLYGADDLLRRFAGVRWLAPGELWTHVPRHRSLSIPEGVYRSEAQLAVRALHTVGVAYHWDDDCSEWMSRLRFNRKAMHADRVWHTWPLLEPLGMLAIGGGHAMRYWMPNEEFFDEHPQQFRLDEGLRRPTGGGGTQICLSDPQVPNAFAGKVNAYADTYPQMDIIGICMNDGWGFCICPDCVSHYRPDRIQSGWLSDLVFGFSNGVSRELAAKHPDRLLLQLAYTNFYKEPPLLPIEPNLMVEYCFWRSEYNRPVADPGNEADADQRRQIVAWADRCDHLLMREYVGGVNLPDARILATDLRWFRELGADGWFTEIHPENWLPRERMWVVAHLLWNPDASVDELLDDFFHAAYGPAQAPMRAVYDLLEQALMAAPRPFPGKSRLAAPYLVPNQRYVRMLGLIAAARELAADDEQVLARIDQTARDLQELRAVARALHDRKLLGQPPVAAPDGSLTAYGERLLTEANLIPNGSFELGPDELGGWYPVRARGHYQLEITDEDALHGRYSAVMRCQERGKSRWVHPEFTVDPDAIYEVNLWYRTTPDAFWTLRFGIAGGEGCSVRTWSTNTAGQWQHLRFTGLTPTSGKMVLWLDNFATGTVYLDAVSVTPMRQQ